MLPHDLLPWKLTYHYYSEWCADGTWLRIEEVLRGRVRRATRKKPTPSALVMDSQCVKTSDQGGPRGFDMAKKVVGRKRHIAVDTLGLIWLLAVTAASVQDRDGGRLLLSRLAKGFSRLKVIWADSAYKAQWLLDWWAKFLPRWRKVRLEIVGGLEGQKGFVVQPKRWVVERTSGWLNKCRRLSKDYERRLDHSETMLRLASIHLMVRRLAPKPAF